MSVSYTHLDVYKRQALRCDSIGQEVRLSTVEKSISNIEQTMSEKISAVEDSVKRVVE